MDVWQLLNRWIMPLKNQVNLMIGRAVVSMLQDSAGLQVMQISVTKDEVLDDVTRVQEYGFTSWPEKDAQVVALFQQGNRKAGLIVAIDDHRHRLVLDASGEVAVYSRFGNKLVMKANGSVEVTPASGQPFKVNGPILATGVITSESEVRVPGAPGTYYKLSTHTHPAPGGATSGPTALP